MLVGMVAVAALAFGAFAFDLPSRVADLGSGNLDRVVAPTTTVWFGEDVELAGRGDRPTLKVSAERARPVRSATKGVRPDKGMVFLGLPISVTNAGETTFDALTGFGVTMTNAEGLTLRLDPRVTKLRHGRVLVLMKLRPGATARGMIVFHVPRGTRPPNAQLTVGSGLTRTAQWSDSD